MGSGRKQSEPSVGRYFRRFGDALPYLYRTMQLIWQAAPNWTAAWIGLLLAQGFVPVVIVYLSRPLVNGIAAAAASRQGWQPILLPAALITLALVVAEILRTAIQWIRTVQSDLVQDHITLLIHNKSLDADLAFYESPEFYDRLHRARAEGNSRPVILVETLGSLLRNGVTLAAMLVVLAGFGLWLPLALLGSTLPVLGMVLRDAVRQHEFRVRTTSLERRAWYHDWLITTGEAAPEVRLFALGEYFKSCYQALREKLRRERFDLVRREGAAQFFAGMAALTVTGVAMIFMVSRTLAGLMSLGDLALFYQAFQQGLSLARALLENVGQLYQNSLFLGNLFEFLELEPKVFSPRKPALAPARVREEIRFQNVTFRYPGSSKIALQDFNLTIGSGRLLAIVGPNGAGKTTLIKLLCRFYDPDAGSIDIDGVDLRNFSVEELRERITVLFQQPMRYNATVADNIRFGDLSIELSDGAIRKAALDAGAAPIIERLPERYGNLLGHWFEKGAELSTGEWQRLALARAFLRQAPIILLDEPTTALDPWAEADWLRSFRNLAQGRTTVLITHRFTTAMLADEIHVMEEGRILESGEHSELIHRGGRYAQWWRMQHAQ